MIVHVLISTALTSGAKRPDDMGRSRLRWSQALSQYPDERLSEYE